MSRKIDELKFIHLSWKQVEDFIIELAEKIRRSGFRPDIIVAVSRGGFDPARLLCDQMMIRRLASLQVEYYEGMEVLGEPKIVIPLNADVEGLKVLLIDDVSDTGDSLNLAIQHIRDHGSEEVKIATLHCKPWSNFKPDFYVKSVKSWIVYPWELKETLLTIAEKLEREEYDRSEIPLKLEKMGFKTKDIRRYMENGSQ
ncbi:MAG: phosphoribosyltransferase [Candidatus Bathyarchaeia archaeon]